MGESRSREATLKQQRMVTWSRKVVLGWPKGSFRFAHKVLWNSLNELFGQPNILPDITEEPSYRLYGCKESDTTEVI